VGEEMKERPIIFTSESVKAILAGRKTMTRRVVKPQPPLHAGNIEESEKYPGEFFYWVDGRNKSTSFFCPYGQPGTKLWVKETFCIEHQGTIHYRADGWASNEDRPSGWTSPFFMPHWASRITLEVIDIQAQRVQDISEEDAIAEGILPFSDHHKNILLADGWGQNRIANLTINQFAHLWDSINGKKYPWEKNPWCWCVSFHGASPIIR
jgi:hypothetical protein